MKPEVLKQDEGNFEEAEKIVALKAEVDAIYREIHEAYKQFFLETGSLPGPIKNQRLKILNKLYGMAPNPPRFEALQITIGQDSTGWGFRIESTPENPIQFSYCLHRPEMDSVNCKIDNHQTRTGGGDMHYESKNPNGFEKLANNRFTLQTERQYNAEIAVREEEYQTLLAAHTKARQAAKPWLERLGILSSNTPAMPVKKEVQVNDGALYGTAQRELVRIKACLTDFLTVLNTEIEKSAPKKNAVQELR